ncbi:hypothetical protein [Actinomadura gamaensis]|uniref:Uncharacterized protein n=1 Tax=Actinomadura gamaensis TaxID=1763541 RepID=A0ABV9U0E1_9ACTN
MPNPQQPEIRRSERTAVTEDPPADPKNPVTKGHEHGTDKGDRGGGKGGGVPPDQQPPHPA